MKLSDKTMIKIAFGAHQMRYNNHITLMWKLLCRDNVPAMIGFSIKNCSSIGIAFQYPEEVYERLKKQYARA